jgi:hypothetical protein
MYWSDSMAKFGGYAFSTIIFPLFVCVSFSVVVFKMVSEIGGSFRHRVLVVSVPILVTLLLLFSLYAMVQWGGAH